jgi:hypothetical protein
MLLSGPLSASEQQHTWKRLKTHHMDTSTRTVTLQSSNHLPVNLLHIPNARIGSSHASARTRRARASLIQHINNVSASPPASTPQQQQHNYNIQLDALYKKLDILVSHKLSIYDMLQFDKLTYLPYNLVRTIRSFLNNHDRSIFPSEYAMRKQAKQLALTYEVGTFTMLDGIIVHFCRISDISSLLNTTIYSLFHNRQLMHYPNMPHNQIQIQTQTDKGADITKLSVQILNQSIINSVKHVLPLACYEGKHVLIIFFVWFCCVLLCFVFFFFWGEGV